METDKRKRGREGLPDGTLRVNCGCWMVKHQGRLRTCKSVWEEITGNELGRGMTVQPIDLDSPVWPDGFQVVRINSSSAEIKQRIGKPKVKGDRTRKPPPDLSCRVAVPHPTQPRTFVWRKIGD